MSVTRRQITRVALFAGMLFILWLGSTLDGDRFIFVWMALLYGLGVGYYYARN